ncbi:MAG: hypothetical protein HPY59_02875 [Anaerolineae bacterium]|nr:hypothetical protein [Anaerolineae bacterium]
MNPMNRYHPEFYDNHAYPFDEPHTIPAGWDAEALMRPYSNDLQRELGETEAPQSTSNQVSADRDDAKNPVS